MAPAATGARLFARYAYPPNDLGYCGPAETAALFETAATGCAEADIAAIACKFSGAWPYLAALAEQTGVGDPLDERLVRAYWTGSTLLDELDRVAFGSRLLDALSSQAGSYWRHLGPGLLAEAAPTHGFHVFGVYPWSRLLAAGVVEEPLRVLDNCRIRWGQVLDVADDRCLVRSRRLTWDGCRLGLAAPSEDLVRWTVAGRGFVPDPQPGQWLALHWEWVCERLDGDQLGQLRRHTGRQLRATNARLARERAVSA